MVSQILCLMHLCVSSGSIVITLDMTGGLEDIDPAVKAILTELQNGLTVTVGGITYKADNHLKVDGQDKWEDKVEVNSFTKLNGQS